MTTRAPAVLINAPYGAYLLLNVEVDANLKIDADLKIDAIYAIKILLSGKLLLCLTLPLLSGIYWKIFADFLPLPQAFTNSAGFYHRQVI